MKVKYIGKQTCCYSGWYLCQVFNEGVGSSWLAANAMTNHEKGPQGHKASGRDTEEKRGSICHSSVPSDFTLC